MGWVDTLGDREEERREKVTFWSIEKYTRFHTKPCARHLMHIHGLRTVPTIPIAGTVIPLCFFLMPFLV